MEIGLGPMDTNRVPLVKRDRGIEEKMGEWWF